ncbi:endonuclease SmrB [Buchnera aphidicola]|uniref:Endonuclease SmrB n=1 Tax=Buchnera aphidicola (Anoecia oenotherae) TaxID=1241833 RepID=A0A4D6XV15_9GAMM|nr:endonuclease SmrB [Buchnera aphidicola]QCI19217.1 endonuclease SmrB [Buchnera aphidicola (Anoecia oenotherae)]
MYNNKKILKKYLHGTKKIVQDTVFKPKKILKKRNFFFKKKLQEEEIHSYLFSYTTPLKLYNENTVSYVRDKKNIKKLKKLSQGYYVPEIFIDVHGLNQYQAKKELGKLFFICHKENLSCAGIIHGHGKNILKKQIPLWLVQHPDTIAFHRAPCKLNKNQTTLFLLIDISI